MSDFLLELYSEEIPPNLQINARDELCEKIKNNLIDEGLKFSSIKSYSTPTRLTILIKDLLERIKIPSKEIKGPKVGVVQDILDNFLKAHNVTKKELFQKQIEKGRFYFIRTKSKEIFVKDTLIKIILNNIASIRWKKSMKWSDKELLWGRPLRSILAIYNGKTVHFNYGHLKSNNLTFVDKDIEVKSKKIINYEEYLKYLKK